MYQYVDNINICISLLVVWLYSFLLTMTVFGHKYWECMGASLVNSDVYVATRTPERIFVNFFFFFF